MVARRPLRATIVVMDDINQDNMAPAPEEHGGGLKQAIIGLIIIIVLLALGFWLYSAVLPGFGVEDLGDGREVVTPREGTVVENFPQELLLERGAAVESSYSLNYIDDNLQQPVVRYISELDVVENVSMFRKFFEDNGWEIVKAANPDDPSGSTSMYAKKDLGEANVVFMADAETGDVSVQIGYLQK